MSSSTLRHLFHTTNNARTLTRCRHSIKRRHSVPSYYVHKSTKSANAAVFCEAWQRSMTDGRTRHGGRGGTMRARSPFVTAALTSGSCSTRRQLKSRNFNSKYVIFKFAPSSFHTLRADVISDECLSPIAASSWLNSHIALRVYTCQSLDNDPLPRAAYKQNRNKTDFKS